MSLFAYDGPDVVYPQLRVAPDRVAPFTLTAGDRVEFVDVDPPADDHWKPSKATTGAKLPDNADAPVAEDSPSDPTPDPVAEAPAAPQES